MKNRRIALALGACLVIISACGREDNSPPTTAADPPGGSYWQPLEVTLTASEPALVYYSVDGSDPVPDSPATKSGESPVSGIAISSDTVLKFFSLDRNKNREETKTENYFLDQTAPASQINVPTAGSFVGGTVEVNGTARDDSSGVARVEISTDGGQNWAGTILPEPGGSGDRPWSYSFSPSAEGETSICSRAVDQGGNQESPPTCLTVTADLTPPEALILAPKSDQYLSSHSPIPVSGLASDNLSGVELVEVTTDGGLTFAPASGTETWSYPWSPPAGDGSYLIAARATDGAGNPGSPTPDLSVKIDNTPPLSWVTFPAGGQFVKGSNTIRIQAADSGSGIARVEVQVGSAGSWAEARASTGEWTYTWDFKQVPEGSCVVKSRATDRAGNQEVPGSGRTFSVDNTLPVSTILTPAPDLFLGITTTPISGTAADAGSGVAKVEVSTDAGYTWKTATGKEAWSYLWDISGSGEFWGDRILVSRATDKAGNVEFPYPQVTVKIDGIAPQIAVTFPSDQSIFNWPGGVSREITVRASDVGAGINYTEIRIVKDPYVLEWTPVLHRISYPNPPNGTYDATYFWNPIPGSDGAYTVTARAWDQVGNSGYSSPVIVTLDRTPPTVTSADPVAGAFCVRTGSNVRIRFNEEMLPGTLNQTTSGIFKNGATPTSPGFFFTRTVFPNDTLTIVPFESQPQIFLADLDLYTVRISGPMTDLAGNPLSPNPYTFLFATRNSSPPVVVSQWPDSNRLVRAEYFRGVTVTFDKDMNTSQGSISITDQEGIPLIPPLQIGGVSNPASGSLSWTDSKTITMAMGTSITVQPGTGYLISFSSLSDQSACGSDPQNNSPARLEWPVITRGMPKDVTAPALVSSLPGAGGTASPLLSDYAWNSFLLLFDEPLDPETLVPANFQVTGFSSDFGVGYQIGVDPPGMGVLIRPNLPLSPGPVSVELLTGIKDSAGNPLAASIPLNFMISGSNPGPPALTAGQPAAGADFYTESFQGVVGFNREITTFVLSPANVRLKNNTTGIPVRGLNFDSLSLDRPGQVSLRIRGGTRTPALETDTEYRLELWDLKDLYGNFLSPNPSTRTFRTRPAGENRRPIIADAFGRAGYAEVFTNGNIHLHFELEASDPDGDFVLSSVEGPAGSQWPLIPGGSNQYEYSTPLNANTVPDSTDEGLSYQGEAAFTFYATDTTYTVSAPRKIYIYPVSSLPIPVSPANGEVTSLTPTLTWNNVDLPTTDYLQVKILVVLYDSAFLLPPFYLNTAIYSATLSPGTTSHVVPAGILDPDPDNNPLIYTYYCWQIIAVRTGPGGDDAGHGTGFRSMSNWPLPMGSSCFQVSP